MVAVFTPQTELQHARYTASKNFLLPAAQFRTPAKYEGRLRVRRDASNGDVTFELLDDTWANVGILENDLIAIEEPGLRVAGCWFLRTVVAGEERNVDPVDPSPEILHTLTNAVSSDPICPNMTRGVLDQTLDVRIGDAVQLDTNNHRDRGTLGHQLLGSSDNLRQLTFDGDVAGTWLLGDTVSGGTSGAVGTVVGLSPRITLGGSGHWIVADMGVDYAGAEWTLGEVATSGSGATGTLRADALGARSFSPLTKTGSVSAFSNWFALSTSLQQFAHYPLDDPDPGSPGFNDDICFDRLGVLEPLRFLNADGPPIFQQPGPMPGSTAIEFRTTPDDFNLNQPGGSRLILPFIGANDSYSIECFFKFLIIPTAGQNVAFVSYETLNGVVRLGRVTSTGKIASEVAGDGATTGALSTTGPSVNDFGWHSAILVRDAVNDEVRTYLDGARIQTTSYPGSDDQTAGVATQEQLSFGNHDQNDNRRLDGFLSNIVFYSVAVNDAQAAALHSASGI